MKVVLKYLSCTVSVSASLPPIVFLCPFRSLYECDVLTMVYAQQARVAGMFEEETMLDQETIVDVPRYAQTERERFVKYYKDFVFRLMHDPRKNIFPGFFIYFCR